LSTTGGTNSSSMLFRFPIWCHERCGKRTRLLGRSSAVGWRDLDYLDALGAQCEGLMLARAAGSVVAITRAGQWQPEEAQGAVYPAGCRVNRRSRGGVLCSLRLRVIMMPGQPGPPSAACSVRTSDRAFSRLCAAST
jgi:hypothetical protein